MPPYARDDPAQAAALALQLDAARAELAVLRERVAQANAQLHDTEWQRMLDANEQLVLAVLRSQDEVAQATAALDALSQAVDRDALTGLPNRAHLRERFGLAAADTRRHGEHVALLFIDLDDFKAVNDTLGHAAGDEVLLVMAGRLTRCVRENDTVSRHGRDEFLVLLPEVTDLADAQTIAGKVLAAIAQPLVVRGQALQLTASIGVSLYPDDAATEAELVERAEAAMHRARQRGGAQAAFHGAVPTATAAEGNPSALTRAGLRRSLAESERLNRLLREANERLVVATLGASELQQAAEKALHQHRGQLALLGHEIRTPLSPLRYAAEIIARGPHAQVALTRLKQLIERQVAQIARLVDDMMALSKMARDHEELDLAPGWTDVVALARQAVDTCHLLAQARLQTLLLESDQPVERACVDAGRVLQVITNLVDNASKYTPAHGRIVVTVGGTADEVTVRVRDTGMGISAAAIQHVFEPFARAPEALASGSSGMGIGLTVVQQLVAAHHGTVQAHSDGLGRGAEFVVRLPRQGPV